MREIVIPANRRICTKTIIDDSDPNTTFDAEGICSEYHEYLRRSKIELFNGEDGVFRAREIADRVKRETRGKDYNCIIGLSGGIDSSYVAYIVVKELGLNPLAIHLDNGWNSELATANIENLVKRLNLDLYTEVLDWEEFRELQKAFFRASVGNVEMATDHAINATLFKQASAFGIKYIFTGSNLNSESIVQFGGWGHDNKDWVNIYDINRKFGTRPLVSYPHLTKISFFSAIFIKRLRFIPILNFFEYKKKEAIEILARDLGWRKYERKHGESIFTRFFQEYYLPEKFGVDKRRSHLSSLICSGQITREEALSEIEKPLFKSGEKEELVEYACKKLGFSIQDWEQIMRTPPIKHTEYKTDHILSARNNWFYRYGRMIATGRKEM